MVEVVARFETSPRYRYGSGLLVGKEVLTAAHVVAGAKSVSVRGPDKIERPALLDGALIGNPDGCDMALLPIPDGDEATGVELALVRRDGPGGEIVENCWSVGYPVSQEVHRDAPVPSRIVRETVEVRGCIPPLSGLVEGLLSLKVTHEPRALPEQRIRAGESEWSGMSGAPVFAGDLLVGVVGEHAPARGTSDLSVVPFSHPDAAPWLRRLGVTHPGALPMLPRLAALVADARLPPRPPPSSLLRGEFGIVPFHGREDELRWLTEWCQDAGQASVRLVTAPGGQGKTRLARELCLRIGAEWTAGFVRPTATEEEIAALARRRGPCLLVVDYAETLAPQVRTIVNAFTTAPRLRLLLLARSVGDWLDKLREDADESLAALLLGAGELALEPLPPDVDDRRAVFRQARDAFADHVGMDSATVPPPPGLDETRYGLTLTLHMAALAALLDAADDGGKPDPHPTRRDPAVRVLDHERRYWRRAAAALDLDLGTEILDQVVAVATLYAPGDRDAANRLLAHLGDLGDQPQLVRSRCLAWAAQLHPGDRPLPPLQPDLLGEEHVARVLRQTPEVVEALAPVAKEDEVRQALRVLGRAAPRHDHLVPPLTRLVHRDPALLPLAVEVAVELREPGPLVAAIAEDMSPLDDPAILLRVINALPTRTVALADLALLAHQRLVDVLGPVLDRYPELVGTLVALGRRFYHVGAYDQALAVGRRAVASLDGAPDATSRGDDLVLARKVVADAQVALGHPEQALTADRAAVRHYERRYHTDPAGYRVALVHALCDLWRGLTARQRHREAPRHSTRLLNLVREMSGDSHPESQVGIARSLQSVADAMLETGNIDQAIALARESVRLAQSLAAWRPDAYRSTLASALVGTAGILGHCGRPGEAEELAREAVEIRGVLSAQRPEHYTSESVSARDLHAGILFDLGLTAEGFDAMVTCIRELTPHLTRHPEAHLSQTVHLIGNLAAAATRSGRHQPALEILNDMETWCRSASEGSSHPHFPHTKRQRLLGAILATRCTVQQDAKQYADAVHSGEQAVAALRASMAEDSTPSKTRADLAVAYADLALAQGHSQQLAACLDSAAKAVETISTAQDARHAQRVNIAVAVTSLVRVLLNAGEDVAAEKYARLAVDMLRPEAILNPAKRSELAIALHQHAVSLHRVRSPRRIHVINELINLRRRLAEENPSPQAQKDLDLALRLQGSMLRQSDDMTRDVRGASTPAGAALATPRKAPCPCGSGRRYKRCCGRPPG
ncbi:trypsin-like peptidase domain-containing protein [Streptomyces sp. NPDC051132]|uniref:trypsin-like peptidase domain-containing protein n=1 Tax=unclassified Streptomyces TaxID=2593676 RepID=UPI00344ABE9C